MLDVGTGSGILPELPLCWGQSKVYACDIDPVAVEVARRGFIGSVDAVAAAASIPCRQHQPEAIVGLAPDLLRVLRPGGVLLASGIESPEIAQVRPRSRWRAKCGKR